MLRRIDGKRGGLLAGAFACAAVSSTPAFAEADWFVILASSKSDRAIAARSTELQRKCRQTVFFSGTGSISGMRPGLMIAYVGPFTRKSEAQKALRSVRKCAPDAYIKAGEYIGDE